MAASMDFMFPEPIILVSPFLFEIAAGAARKLGSVLGIRDLLFAFVRLPHCPLSLMPLRYLFWCL